MEDIDIGNWTLIYWLRTSYTNRCTISTGPLPGIEPGSRSSKPRILPLNYRGVFRVSHTLAINKLHNVNCKITYIATSLHFNFINISLSLFNILIKYYLFSIKIYIFFASSLVNCSIDDMSLTFLSLYLLHSIHLKVL